MTGQGCCKPACSLHSEAFGCALPATWEMKAEIPADTENLPHNMPNTNISNGGNMPRLFWGQLVGRFVGTMASWAAIPNAA